MEVEPDQQIPIEKPDPETAVHHFHAADGDHQTTVQEQRMVEEQIIPVNKTFVRELESPGPEEAQTEVGEVSDAVLEAFFGERKWENRRFVPMTEVEKEFVRQLDESEKVTDEDYREMQREDEKRFIAENIDHYGIPNLFLEMCINLLDKTTSGNPVDRRIVKVLLRLIGFRLYRDMQGVAPLGYNPNITDMMADEFLEPSLLAAFMYEIGQWYTGFRNRLLQVFDYRIQQVQLGLDSVYIQFQMDDVKKDGYMRAIASNHETKRLQYGLLPKRLMDVLVAQYIFGFAYLPVNFLEMVQNGSESIFVDTKNQHLFPGFGSIRPGITPMGRLEQFIELLSVLNEPENAANLANALVGHYLLTTAASKSRGILEQFNTFDDKLWDIMEMATKCVRVAPMKDKFVEREKTYWKDGARKVVTVTKPRKCQRDEEDIIVRLDILKEILKKNYKYWDTYTKMRLVNKKMFKPGQRNDQPGNPIVIPEDENQGKEEEKKE